MNPQSNSTIWSLWQFIIRTNCKLQFMFFSSLHQCFFQMGVVQDSWNQQTRQPWIMNPNDSTHIVSQAFAACLGIRNILSTVSWRWYPPMSLRYSWVSWGILPTKCGGFVSERWAQKSSCSSRAIAIWRYTLLLGKPMCRLNSPLQPLQPKHERLVKLGWFFC